MLESKLTINKALRIICDLAKQQYRSQEMVFADIFCSYHSEQSQKMGYVYITPASVVSQIVNGARGFPRKIVGYYTYRNPDALYKDLEAFFVIAVQTERQRILYTQSLIDAVECCSNLLDADKQSILAVAQDPNYTPCDLWHKALYVLLREP